jgi:hypothetical protein
MRLILWIGLMPAPAAVVGQAVTAPVDTGRMRAYESAMQSDLRNLDVALQAYQRLNGRFAPSMQFLPGFRTATAVSLFIVASGDDHYSAIAIHSGAPGAICAIWVSANGTTLSPPLADGSLSGRPSCRRPWPLSA